MQARKVVRNRLFPLKGHFPAASVKSGIEISNSSNPDDEFVKTRFADNEDTYDYYFECIVEPNGYFLIKTFLPATPDDGAHENGIVATVALKNGLLCYEIEAGKILLDSFLKTDILTVVHSSKKHHQLCAVNQQANQIYLYTVDVVSKSIQNLFSRKRLAPELRLVPSTNLEKTIGVCIFDSKNRKIANIAGSPALKNHILTIAFADGEIIVGKIKNQQFRQIKQLQQPGGAHGKVTLLASEDGCVVAYYSATQSLHTWFLHQEYHAEFYMQKYANAMLPTYAKYDNANLSNVAISSDGDYVYGLEVQPDGKHQTVQCYSLHELSGIQRIKFTYAIADFAIGEKGQAVVIRQEADCQGEKGLPTMITLVNIKHLLQREEDAIDLNQLMLISSLKV